MTKYIAGWFLENICLCMSYFCVVAERISYERGENVGDTVGYKVLCTSYVLKF